MLERIELQPGQVWLRLIQPGTGPSARTVLGRSYIPLVDGINGKGGFGGGKYSRPLYEGTSEPGDFTLTFPNAGGTDGVQHRDRFLIVSDPDFHVGDEFIEIWRELELLFVGAVSDYALSPSTLVLTGTDGLGLAKLWRETACGYWNQSPRDVWEHYCRAPVAQIDDPFDQTVAYTYSTSSQTSADGKWDYLRTVTDPTKPDTVTLKTSITANAVASLTATSGYDFPFGLLSSEPHTPWRLEAIWQRRGKYQTGTHQNLILGINDSVANVTVQARARNTGRIYEVLNGEQATNNTILSTTVADTESEAPTSPESFIIEGRGRWIFFYFNGVLEAILAMPAQHDTTGTHVTTGRAFFKTTNDSTAPSVELITDVDAILLRRSEQLLLPASDLGEYRLPGVPTPGGVAATYFNEAGASALTYLNPSRNREKQTIDGVVIPGYYARRIEATIDNAAQTASPPNDGGSPPATFSVRWTGAINLDLANYDYRLRVIRGIQGIIYARLWVGKTRIGEELVVDWATGNAILTSDYLRNTLPQLSGWYPLLMEMATSSNWTARLEYERSDAPGTWTTVPATMLSPEGIYNAQVAYDSHYEQLQALIRQYGYQAVCEPRSLESGEFPGRLAPKIRVGRDTEYELDKIEATGVQTQVSAQQTIDELIADAAGVGDVSQIDNLTLSVINYGSVGSHLFIASDYESLSDITILALLTQRMESILGLRSSPFEQVQANPQGTSQLADSFPLTGQLAEFAWEPGDGIRLNFPDIAVIDTVPRQILRLERTFTPDALGAAVASFGQRPRDFLAIVRRVLRGLDLAARNRNRGRPA